MHLSHAVSAICQSFTPFTDPQSDWFTRTPGNHTITSSSACAGNPTSSAFFIRFSIATDFLWQTKLRASLHHSIHEALDLHSSLASRSFSRTTTYYCWVKSSCHYHTRHKKSTITLAIGGSGYTPTWLCRNQICGCRVRERKSATSFHISCLLVHPAHIHLNPLRLPPDPGYPHIVHTRCTLLHDLVC